MALESVTHISDLVASNPVLTDSRSEGDDHIRNIKDVLLRDFPNINAIVSSTPAELNYLVGVTSNIQTQLGNIDSSQYVNGSIDTIHIADLNITTAKIADVNVTTAKIADDAVTTAKVLDANITFAKIVSASATNKILGRVTGGSGAFEEVTLQTTLSSSDEAIPTSKAVRDDIVAIVNAVGGFVAIATEVTFPNAHPDPDDGAGTVVSIANVGGVVVDGAGQSTTGRTVGGTTVTITGIPSTYQSTTIADGLGMQVISTSTLNTYGYHKIVPKEGDTNIVATNIANINIVAGDVVYSEDLGSVADALTTSSGSGDITTVADAIANINTLAAAAVIADMALLGTAAVVTDLDILATADVVSDLNTLGTADVVADLNTLGTADVVSDMNVLGTSGNVTAMSTVATSIADVNRYANEYTIASSAPGSPTEGDLWYDSTANVLKYYTGSIFAALAPGISDVVSDTSPQLGGALDGQNNNFTNCGTLSGTNLQMDFGGLS